MKILVVGDTHIQEKNLEELNTIFPEILKQDADMLVHLGDFFEKSNPSPLELDFGTEWIKKFKEKYNKVVIIDSQSHTRITKKLSAITYLRHFDVTIKDTYTYEDEEYKAFFGHFFTDKSTPYSTECVKLSSLKGFDHIVLGHLHSLKILKGTIKRPKALHLGSAIYCRFDEVNVNKKFVAIIDTKEKALELVALNTPIPMVKAYSFEELEKVPCKTKVCLELTVSDFISQLPKIKEYQNKFYSLKIVKVKKEKTQINLPDKQAEHINFKEVIDKITNGEVKKELIEQFKKRGIYE